VDNSPLISCEGVGERHLSFTQRLKRGQTLPLGFQRTEQVAIMELIKWSSGECRLKSNNGGRDGFGGSADEPTRYTG
jgi:hypothetical protein